MHEGVKKFLFIGPLEDKEHFFKRAQVQGLIHFINSTSSARKEVPQDVQCVITAIKLLRSLPSKEQEKNFNELNADQIADTILHVHEQNEKLLEELRVLNIEKARLDIFGDFSLEDKVDIEKRGKCQIQFFCGHSNLFIDQSEPENLIFIASEHELNYYMAINDHPVAYEKMIEMKFERSLSELKHCEALTLEKQHLVEHAFKEQEKYKQFLHHALVEKVNHHHLTDAQEDVQQVMEGSLFAIEGWVPEKQIQQLKQLTGPLNVYFEEIAIEPTDVIPTYLENEGLSRLGEDLVHIYDTPSATDKDPSLWVLFGFTLFFAFIIGDAGYGLIYLATALFLRYKYPNLKGMAKRVLNLFTVLCIGCVIWGTLMTSFFGMQIALDNPVRKLSLVQWLAEKKAAYHLGNVEDETIQGWIEKYPELSEVKDAYEFVSFSPGSEPHAVPLILNRLTDNVMFELALFIGVLHLISSLFRYVRRNWQNIGWIAFLIGAYLYFPLYLQTPSFLNYVGGIDLIKGGEIGFQLMIGGIGIAWILAIVRHGWTGIFEVMVLIQVFADTLSYLRLYALGLAGAIVGSTINEIASGMPLILGALLILVSHLVNIILGTMSGVIHGLRLNFLEWYHYSFEGGGRRFQPLKLINKE